jgi:hypothetical protein
MKVRSTAQNRESCDQEGIWPKGGWEFKKGIQKRWKEGGRSNHAIRGRPSFHGGDLAIPIFVSIAGYEIIFLPFIEKGVGTGKCKKHSHKEDKENRAPFPHSLCDLIWKDLVLILRIPKPSVKQKIAPQSEDFPFP